MRNHAQWRIRDVEDVGPPMKHPVDAWLLGAAVFLVALFGGGWWYVSRQPLPEVEDVLQLEDPPLSATVSTTLEWAAEHVWVTTQVGERSVTHRHPLPLLDHTIHGGDTGCVTEKDGGIAIVIEGERVWPDHSPVDLGTPARAWDCADIDWDAVNAAPAKWRRVYCRDTPDGPLRVVYPDGGEP